MDLYSTCCNLNSYDQVKRHPSAWDLVGGGQVDAKGYGIPTHVQFFSNDALCLNKGSSRGFYFTFTNGAYMVHTISDNLVTSDLYVSNSDLAIFVGIGTQHYFQPEYHFNSVWNGAFNYLLLEEYKLIDDVESSVIRIFSKPLLFACFVLVIPMLLI